MHDALHENAGLDLSIEHDVTSMLHPTPSWVGFTIGTTQLRIFCKQDTEVFKSIKILVDL